MSRRTLTLPSEADLPPDPDAVAWVDDDDGLLGREQLDLGVRLPAEGPHGPEPTDLSEQDLPALPPEPWPDDDRDGDEDVDWDDLLLEPGDGEPG
jgi:hypothetical protein